MLRTSSGERVSSACNRLATMPETNGVAMLVPSLESYSLSASGRSG